MKNLYFTLALLLSLIMAKAQQLNNHVPPTALGTQNNFNVINPLDTIQRKIILDMGNGRSTYIPTSSSIRDTIASNKGIIKRLNVGGSISSIFSSPQVSFVVTPLDTGDFHIAAAYYDDKKLNIFYNTAAHGNAAGGKNTSNYYAGTFIPGLIGFDFMRATVLSDSTIVGSSVDQVQLATSKFNGTGRNAVHLLIDTVGGKGGFYLSKYPLGDHIRYNPATMGNYFNVTTDGKINATNTIVTNSDLILNGQAFTTNFKSMTFGNSAINTLWGIEGVTPIFGNSNDVVFGTQQNTNLRFIVNNTIGATLNAGGLGVSGVIKTAGYTVSTLPTGSIGERAYVIDALTPVPLAPVTGGGTSFAPVIHNGITWIVD